eukprot:CAMPEP_0195541128 /NCGR_PEP_ID=MMETSP0794_2-20130614/50926_1 /TAXON_ID=515487 /ORGANISM="Stephanopyxis turris, Strain CCMP 815" /LENGTH=268 /DNA_ID=CAMNT_0040675213 /DNA_START=749 /DNA_END=1555 /DNA_ORIENTATION=+
MTSPVVSVSEIMEAGNIEQLLLETTHTGFPVVDVETQKLLGLVRRDQLVALLECGFFVNESAEEESIGSVLSSHTTTNDRTKQRARQFLSWENSSVLSSDSFRGPMAHNIRDDRYEKLQERSGKCCWNLCEKFDDFLDNHSDSFSWLSENVMIHDDDTVTLGLDETLPAHGNIAVKLNTTVAVENGVLVVHLAPEDKRKKVRISSVMNRGAYCVTEGCPLSKAYTLFTKVGLRHLCVIGGEGGGKVVGIVSRYNLTDEYIEERTGFKL